MTADNIAKILEILGSCGVVGIILILFYRWRTNEADLFVDETKLRQQRIEKNIDSLNLTDLVERANTRNSSDQGDGKP